MRIADILKQKDHDRVVTVLPSDPIPKVASLLLDQQIGAVVVREASGRVAGLLGERDIVRGLAKERAGVLALEVRHLMNPDAATCTPEDQIRDVIRVMTVRRCRHLPVIEAGRLVGIVSIGDVLKSRLAEQQQEEAVLLDLSRARG
jgi:CBS domain-containing protein